MSIIFYIKSTDPKKELTTLKTLGFVWRSGCLITAGDISQCETKYFKICLNAEEKKVLTKTTEINNNSFYVFSFATFLQIFSIIQSNSFYQLAKNLYSEERLYRRVPYLVREDF